MAKQPIGVNVLDAAISRIRRVFDDFPKIYLSFSGGKDSSVMFHLVMQEAQRRERRVGVLFVDLEAQYSATALHVQEMYSLYQEWVDPYWVCLPLSLRNAVSVYDPKWQCWDPDREGDWVRPLPSGCISDVSQFPFFRRGMEFEEFVPAFGDWYADGKLCACFVGIRTDESLNRYRSIAGRKASFEGLHWTTRATPFLYNCYPIYDWRTADIWRFNGKFNAPYNPLYDLMHKAGLSIHQARICQPYGDDQRKGLYLYHVIEPETWAKVVRRVSGANSGAEYSQHSGNVNGVRKISKPAGMSWEDYAHILLESMPAKTRDHFEDKIAVFLKWYQDRGYPNGIPDEGPASDRDTPSWTRICKALLRNDYWCKGLSFTQQKTEAYLRYKRLMKKRRESWELI